MLRFSGIYMPAVIAVAVASAQSPFTGFSAGNLIVFPQRVSGNGGHSDAGTGSAPELPRRQQRLHHGERERELPKCLGERRAGRQLRCDVADLPGSVDHGRGPGEYTRRRSHAACYQVRRLLQCAF
jgi:hypothetical protein